MSVISPNLYVRIEVKTASYQLKAEDVGKIFTTRGASGAVTFTLPDTTGLAAGWNCKFYNIADQNMAIASYGSNDDICTTNDATADSITYSTAVELIGSNLSVVWDGTSWLTFFGNNEAITPTIA